MRKKITSLFLVVGISLAAVSFFLAIPPSSIGSSPKMPFASVTFILGVIMSFLSAVVYELTPGKD